jgi:hypothetical protein
MKGRNVAAVISISGYQEGITGAIESVCRLKEYFTEVHIVHPPKYELSDSVRQALGPLPCHTHCEELTKATLSKDTLLLVHIQPDHKVEEDALIDLLESAQESRVSCDHYAVRGKVECEHQRYPALLGFVWFVAFMDYFRTLLNARGYHNTNDLRATKVTPHFPSHSTISKYQHAWFFSLFSRIASIRFSSSSLTQIPRDPLFVFRSIHTHAHMSIWNAQWIIGYLIYYSLFALPWWNVFLPTFGPTPGGPVGGSSFEPTPGGSGGGFVVYSIKVLLHWLLHRNMFSMIWFSVWVIHILICMFIVTARYKHANLSWVFLMPVYVTLSPIVFLVARIKILKPQ